MRRIRPEYDFDMWIPKLSPPENLLNDYVIDKKISWKVFSNRFYKQVILKNKKLIKIIVELSKKNKVVLLCAEKNSRYCHRSIVLKECLKLLQS